MSSPGRVVVHRGQAFDVFELDLSTQTIDLVGQRDASLRTLRRVREHYAPRRWTVATNAGMFHEGQVPVGLHVEQGQILHPLERGRGRGNFYMLPNGVFYIDDEGAHVVETSKYSPGEHLRLATQSGPLLVDKGNLHPSFAVDSEHRHLRNAVGVTRAGEVVIAISRDEVTFHELATLFRNVLDCPSALYLDGTISDFATPEHAPSQSHTYGGVLVARPRGEQ